jgi:phosphoribosylpyrophosphate synthetase
MSRHIFEQLDTADQALRENLHRNDLDPTAREHMERALSHVREAYIATNDIGKARSVQQLVDDLEKVSHIVSKVRRRERTTTPTKPIRI